MFKQPESINIIKNFIIAISEKEETNIEILLEKEEIKDLIKLYNSNSNFRHSYNKITRILQNFTEQDLMMIQQNLDRLIYKWPNCTGEKFYKLYDHISLEISRRAIWESNRKKISNIENSVKEKVNNILENYEEIKNDFNNTQQNLEKTKLELSLSQEKLAKAEKSIKNSKTEFITILSIFAAIIIAFAGGLGFSNNALAALADVPLYKAGFMVAVCGVVLFNSICGLLHVIAKLSEKDILHYCKNFQPFSTPIREGQIQSCHNCKNGCSWHKKVRLRLPYAYYVNVLFIAIMVLMTILRLMYWGKYSNIISSFI